jgi:hypothetical protein
MLVPSCCRLPAGSAQTHADIVSRCSKSIRYGRIRDRCRGNWAGAGSYSAAALPQPWLAPLFFGGVKNAGASRAGVDAVGQVALAVNLETPGACELRAVGSVRALRVGRRIGRGLLLRLCHRCGSCRLGSSLGRSGHWQRDGYSARKRFTWSADHIAGEHGPLRLPGNVPLVAEEDQHQSHDDDNDAANHPRWFYHNMHTLWFILTAAFRSRVSSRS